MAAAERPGEGLASGTRSRKAQVLDFSRRLSIDAFPIGSMDRSIDRRLARSFTSFRSIVRFIIRSFCSPPIRLVCSFARSIDRSDDRLRFGVWLQAQSWMDRTRRQLVITSISIRSELPWKTQIMIQETYVCKSGGNLLMEMEMEIRLKTHGD
jgi:hypothetical protein